jgi:hypothetical protein
VQQGASAPQIGVEPPVDPAGNQQQQPLQSIHDETCVSGLHSAAHAEVPLSVLDFDASAVLPVELASVVSLDPLLVPLPLPLLVPLPLPLLVPLPLPLLVPLPLPLLVPLLPAASLAVEPLDPDPLSSSLDEPGLLELLQAASPTVDDAPMTTMT